MEGEDWGEPGARGKCLIVHSSQFTHDIGVCEAVNGSEVD